MSKLAHSDAASMAEIERRAQFDHDGPDEDFMSDRRCVSNVCAPDGSCLACNAIQGEACQSPLADRETPF